MIANEKIRTMWNLELIFIANASAQSVICPAMFMVTGVLGPESNAHGLFRRLLHQKFTGDACSDSVLKRFCFQLRSQREARRSYGQETDMVGGTEYLTASDSRKM